MTTPLRAPGVEDGMTAEDSMAMLVAAVEQVAEAIAITDPDGTIAYANTAFQTLTGLPASGAMGWMLADLLEREEVRKALRQAAHGDPWQGQMNLGGPGLEVAMTCSPVRDGRGAVSHLVMVMRDVTKEKHLERGLRQAQKMDALGSLAAGIAHDSNNVLTTILTAAELIKWKLPPDHPVLAQVEVILQAGHYAAGLNKQILSFSHKSEEKPLPLDLSTIIRDVLQMLRSTLPAYIEIRSELASGVWVVGDPVQLHQIILNLAINAFHAMRPAGGVLHVSLTETRVDDHAPQPSLCTGSYALLSVRDTGCGMDAPTMERIFEPFFTTKPQGEGTGLGLSVVHASVLKAGGKIELSSEPGEGTEFQIHWPCAVGRELPVDDRPPEIGRGNESIRFVDSEVRVAAQACAGKAAARRGETVDSAPVPDASSRKEGLILLAEDSHVTRAVIKMWLERTGCDVVEARDGQEAWELFAREPDQFELVLTDVVMPRMDGLELAQLIRAADPALPIAILTTNEDKETVKAALTLGVNEFLNKPFDAQTLIHCVENLLALGRSRLTARRSVETAQAVRQAQKALVAVPEQDLPLFSLSEPLTDAGGDVFRCMKCADGSILFILADVAGHSVLSSYAVASFLAMLSNFVGACNALMVLTAAPGAWDSDAVNLLHCCGQHGKIPCDSLRHLALKLNQGIQSGPFSEIPICALLGRWSPATGRLQLLNAGMPHGLLGHQGSPEVRPLEINGTPLGIFPDPEVEECLFQLEPGDRLLFGTDGFFDVLSSSKRPFQESAPEHWGALQESPIDWALSVICEEARNHGGGVIADDLLVIGFEQPRFTQAAGELVLRLPSIPRAIDMACECLSECIQASGQKLGKGRLFDMLLAVREALTNAVIHGNRNRAEAFVTLRCRPEAERNALLVTVTDEGPGFDLLSHAPPQDPLSERGRGIPLIRTYAQDVRMTGGQLTMNFHTEEQTHDDR